MIKISHESPLSMLEISRTYNDYDYALVHLFEEHPEYYKFFEDSVKMGRHVLLDNSIFELGESFNPKRYAYWIQRLNPTEFIVPDVLEDCQGTIDSAKKCLWHDWDFVTNSKIMGVVQGKTYGELVKCYVALDQEIGVDKLAISFDYSYYLKLFPHPNKWVSYMMGRVMTLNQLMNDGIINKDKPHHLLGCAHPREFSFYQGPEYNWIETLDTSSPVVHGIKRVRYSDAIGNWKKESTKLVDLLDVIPDAMQEKIIANNLIEFRNYVNG